MRTVGWICLVIGVLSFLGAALSGNSVFGPLFWIALGVFLLYRVNNRDDANEQKSKKIEQQTKETTQVQGNIIETIPEHHRDDIPMRSNQQLESIEDIQTQLTLQQREAAMCLISFFGGYNNNLMDDVTIMLLKQSAIFFGLPDSPSVMSKIMSKYTDADTLINIVLTIKPIKAKEFLLLTCYDFIKSSGKSESYELLYNIANDMGYDKLSFERLIRLYQ